MSAIVDELIRKLKADKQPTNPAPAGASIVFAVFIAVFNFLCVVGACFAPATIISFFMYVFCVRKIDGDTPGGNWAQFIAALMCLSLFVAGGFTLHHLLYCTGKFNTNVVIFQMKHWVLFLKIVLWGTLPLFQMFLISFGCYRFRVKYQALVERNGTPCLDLTRKGAIKLALLSLMLYPVTFLIVSVKLGKITWLVSWVLYLVPLALLKTPLNGLAGISLAVMATLSVIHILIIRTEVLMSNKNVVYIVGAR